MDVIKSHTPSLATPYSSRMHGELARGDWESLSRTAGEWLNAEPAQPVATFVQNIACLFTNPPNIIGNKRYLENVGSKDWKAVLEWFKQFQSLSDQHNPYFQALHFILQPSSKKKESIETALAEHPHHPELLFFQAISLRDRSLSLEKLKLALEAKPDFAAAAYLMGIFALQLNQVDAAEGYLNKAVELAPDFLEAHYQLGSLYSLYKPQAADTARMHLEKVIALDPEGGAGRDASKVLEGKGQPQFGQRVSGAGARRGGMSILTILGISLLTFVLFSGPIASLFKVTNPSFGLLAGLLMFVGLYSATRRRK